MKQSRVHDRRWRRTMMLLLLLGAAHPLAAKRKNDVVVMKNGDRLTGEIKGLERGELIFKSDYMTESVHLDWNKVERLESQDRYIVALTNGRRVTGVISKTPTADSSGSDFHIAAGESTVQVKQPEVVGIQQREGSFWNQLTGSINYGLSFASANSHVNSSLGASVAYQTSKNMVDLSTSSQFDRQSTGADANRFTFDSQYGRFLTQKWIAAGMFSLLKSNQQDLNLRSTYGGGLGRRLLRTNSTSILAIGGAVYTHEDYFPQPGSVPVHNNGEGMLGLQFETFRFKTLDINSQAFLFPSFTDPGRVRFSSQSNLNIELVRNFYWSLQVYENYDTRPPVTAPKNDSGITTSLGWKF
jgi:putative salt-induced outer membrane protein YdiY